MANPPASAEILTQVEDTLTNRLPPDWSIQLTREPVITGTSAGASKYRPDAILSVISPDGTTGRLLVELKPSLYPRDTYALKYQLSQYRQEAGSQFGGSLIASRFLTQRTRDMLDAEGLSYADATGNVRIALSRPPFYLEIRGADSNPWAESRPVKSLAGSSSAAVARALLDFKPPYTVSELASRAALQKPTVSRVVNFLAEEAIVIRDPRGPITSVDWEALLRRWAVDYDLFRTNVSQTGFEPRGVEAAIDKLSMVQGEWAITGSVAAQQWVPNAPPALLAVYLETSARRAATAMELREGPSNVVLLEAKTGLPFERATLRQGRRYVALSQVAVDLLSGPGRSPSEAEMLMAWMKRNEDAWRSG